MFSISGGSFSISNPNWVAYPKIKFSVGLKLWLSSIIIKSFGSINFSEPDSSKPFCSSSS